MLGFLIRRPYPTVTRVTDGIHGNWQCLALGDLDHIHFVFFLTRKFENARVIYCLIHPILCCVAMASRRLYQIRSFFIFGPAQFNFHPKFPDSSPAEHLHTQTNRARLNLKVVRTTSEALTGLNSARSSMRYTGQTTLLRTALRTG